MATLPYFILSPNAILSIVGLIRGPDKTVPTPPTDWRDAKVDVIIPARNEESNIAFCLNSLLTQTLKPRRIVLVDDNSSDRTVELASDFGKANGMEVTIVRREQAAGKTPTLKSAARESDCDVEFILDADTILETPTYISRTVEELYKAVGIACACGNVLSLSRGDRKRRLNDPAVKAFQDRHPDVELLSKKNIYVRMQMALTTMYRDCLYMFLQRFVYRGQMTFFGSIMHPVGCAVAYKREYIKDLFNKYEPILGDNLTNSEDIFLGFALVNNGYRNIQLQDVLCRSQDPAINRLPHQFYLWSSAFLQSCYYFNGLVSSPFRAIKRWRHNQAFIKSAAGKAIMEKRKIKEPYREPFGDKYTEEYGRPMGWAILMSAVEKVCFPTALLILIILQKWEALVVTALAETALSLAILTWVSSAGTRIRYLLTGILVTPVRYSALLFDYITILRFAGDVWMRKDTRWRK
ncbi:MAG: glycosyltransferase family 2 protein [bacterium]